MVRFFALLPALFWAMATAFAVPSAAAQGAPETGTIAPAPAEDGSVMFVMATVEGERIELRQTRTADGVDLLDARPIIEALKGQIELDGTVISILRFQDGARLSIDMADGTVTANDQTLGVIANWTPREAADTWLDVNAIAIMTGTKATPQEDGTYEFRLDDRLRPQFDLDLWVDGELIPAGEIEARTIGPVLLLPLRDIVDALGHSLEIDPTNGLITVTRIQDTARIVMDPNTGAIAVNGRLVGVSPNISYAVPEDLLFPSTAVETLTGTHIKLRPGTNRVDIVLDDRIRGGALPDAFVLEEAQKTPFTVERIDYELATNGPQAVAVYAHGGTLNGIGTLTTAGGIQSSGGLQPSTIAIDIESLRGWRASVGDLTDRFRELSGSGAGRVRGASWRRQSEDGDILAVAAGAPLSGSRRISDSVSAPTFGGFAAGARYIRPDKAEELGLAAATAGGDSRFVASAQKQYSSDRPRDKAGLKSASASVGIGAFQGDTPRSFDVEFRGSGSYRLSEQSQLRASGGYRGASFLTRPGRSDTDVETTAEAQTNARLSVDWRAKSDWTILKDPGVVSRISATQSGGRMTHAIGASIGGRIPGIGPNISADISRTTADTDDAGTLTATNATVRMFKRFNWGDGQLALQSTESDNGRDNSLVATVNARPITRFFGEGAAASLSPSATVVSASNGTSGRLGATLTADSGSTFGDRFRMGGQMSAAQSISPDSSTPELFANLSGSYRLNRYVQLTGSVGRGLNGGGSFFLSLRGSAPFNPPRKHTLPVDGRGVLNGRVFLDQNRDGVRQDDEPGLAGIVVGISNTRLRLGADRDGYYTIQNLRSGLYSLNIDRRTLPLGVMVAEDTILRATIAPGQITNLDIPIIISGQIRGSIYVDADASGSRSQGDPRVEGAFLTLRSLSDPDFEPATQFAASFGQYAFESLGPGDYELKAEFDGRSVTQTITLDEENLLLVEDIAFPGAAAPVDPGGNFGGGALVLGTAP